MSPSRQQRTQAGRQRRVRLTCAGTAACGRRAGTGGACGPGQVASPQVPVVGGHGRPYGVWPAEPLKPGWDLAVVEIQVVAAVAADELEQPSAAVWAGCPRTRRLAPQDRHQAMAQLARRDRRRSRGVGAWLLAVVMASPLAAIAGYADGRPMAGHRQYLVDSLDPPPAPAVVVTAPCGTQLSTLWHCPGSGPANAQPCWDEQIAGARLGPGSVPLSADRRPVPPASRAWSAGWRRVAADEAAAVPPGEAGQRR